jgi:hypothetical protein
LEFDGVFELTTSSDADCGISFTGLIETSDRILAFAKTLHHTYPTLVTADQIKLQSLAVYGYATQEQIKLQEVEARAIMPISETLT